MVHAPKQTTEELIEMYKFAAKRCQQEAKSQVIESDEYWQWLEARDGFLNLARLFEEDLAMEEWARTAGTRELME